MGQEVISDLVESLSWTVRGNASGRGNMARLLGSSVCAGVIIIHTPPMDDAKGTAMPVFAHGSLKLLDALLGLFLGGQGCCGSDISGRVCAIDRGGLKQGDQALDLRVLGSCGDGELVEGCTTVSGV